MKKTGKKPPASRDDRLVRVAIKLENRPFVLDDETSETGGMGIWSMMTDGHNLFQNKSFASQMVSRVLEGMARRNIRIAQLHDSDLSLSLKSSRREIVETGEAFVRAAAPMGICVEAVTCNLFADPCFVGGATTNIAQAVRQAALVKGFKLVELAAAINTANTFWPTKLIYSRVREIIGWPGGEEGDSELKPPHLAWSWRMGHWAEVGAYASDLGVATPEQPLVLSEESKPTEPVREIVIATTAEALLFMRIMQGLLPPRVAKCVLLKTNPEVAHEDMAFELFIKAYALAAYLRRLACVHLNGRQRGGVPDLDLAALREVCFWIKFVLHQHPEIPIVLDVKPDRTDLSLPQRWRVVDQSFRSLAWGGQAAKYVHADREVRQILSQFNPYAEMDSLTKPLRVMTSKQRARMADQVYEPDELFNLQEIASRMGNLGWALRHRIDELLHREFPPRNRKPGRMARAHR
ncbi:MAG: hypothetical protein WC518_00085 [Patescibacteria group bacterium]